MPKNKKTAEVMSIKPGSREMETLLSAGYPNIATREHAEIIIEEWKKDHSSHPWKDYQDALAFLAALDSKYDVVTAVGKPGYRADDGVIE